jgi:hypothetical protein
MIHLIDVNNVTAVNLLKPAGFGRDVGSQKATVLKHRLGIVADVQADIKRLVGRQAHPSKPSSANHFKTQWQVLRDYPRILIF